MPLIVSVTLTDDEVSKLELELTTFERPAPDLVVELPILIQHQVIQPIVSRQKQYRQAARLEKLTAFDDTQLAEVDKTIDAQKPSKAEQLRVK